MAKLRRSKKVLALLNERWQSYAFSQYYAARWSLSEDGEAIRRNYPPGDSPQRSKRREEVFKSGANWWLETIKGEGETESTSVKEIVPMQSMAERVYEEWLLFRNSGSWSVKGFCSEFGKMYEGTRAFDTEWIVWHIKQLEDEICQPPAKKRSHEPDPDAEYGKRVKRG